MIYIYIYLYPLKVTFKMVILEPLEQVYLNLQPRNNVILISLVGGLKNIQKNVDPLIFTIEGQ